MNFEQFRLLHAESTVRSSESTRDATVRANGYSSINSSLIETLREAPDPYVGIEGGVGSLKSVFLALNVYDRRSLRITLLQVIERRSGWSVLVLLEFIRGYRASLSNRLDPNRV